MKKISIIALVASITGFILSLIFIIRVCSNEKAVTKDNGTTVTKDTEIIKPVYLQNHLPIYSNVFIDTETGQEYIVFTYNGRVAVTPRLPKEDDTIKKGVEE